MKNLILFLMMLMVPQSFAQTTPNTQTYYEFLNSPVNMIKNPHARLNTVNTVFGGSGAKGRATGSTELYGLAAHTCSTTAVSSYCELTMNAAKAPFNSANKRCEASILYNGANADLMALSYTPSGGQEVLVPLKAVTGTDYAEGYVELSCSSGVGSWRIKQITAGTTGTIKYGGYYGPSTRTGKQSAPNGFTARVTGSGVVSRETPGDWINGNCAYSAPYYTCTYPTSFTTSAMVCQPQIIAGSGSWLTPFVNEGGNTANQVQYGFRDGTGTAVQINHDLVCSKTDPASQYTVATVDNFDSAERVYFTPTVSNLGAGSGTFLTEWNYHTLNGMNANICYRFLKDATNGSGAAEITFSLPPGVTVASNAGAMGAVFTNIAGAGASSIGVFGGLIKVLKGNGNFVTGADVLANTSILGCFTVPTTSKKPANGLINIDVPVFVPYRYTSGSGSLVVPSGARMVVAKVLGGGGGGAGSGLTAGTNSTAGSSSSVGTLVANGGAGGAWGTSVPTGGSCNFGSGWTVIRSVQGGKGYISSDNIRQPGAPGGDSFLGSGGPGGPRQSTGYNPNPNSGAGGGGGGSGINGAPYPGVGGAAGAYCEAYKMVAPGETLNWSVGNFGNGGGPGSEGAGGGTGGEGLVEIEVHYSNFTPALASGLLQRLPGAVTSSGTTPELILRGSISSNGSTCTVNHQTPGMFTSTTGTRNSAGYCTFPLKSGMFSADQVSCGCSTLGTASAPACTVNISSTSNSMDTVRSAAGVNGDGAMTFLCIGPRAP